MRRRQVHAALGRFAGSEPFLLGFQSVIHRISDHMGQRIGQPFDDGLVDFRSLAKGVQAHVLVHGGRGFPHDARHALEQRFDRLRADHHDAVLNVACQALKLFQPAHRIGMGGKTGLLQTLAQHRLVDDQFADEVDQPLDTVEIDANDRFCGGWRRLAGLDFRLWRGRRGRVSAGCRRFRWRSRLRWFRSFGLFGCCHWGFRIHRTNFKHAEAFDKFENRGNLALFYGGCQGDLPAQVWNFRRQLMQIG